MRRSLILASLILSAAGCGEGTSPLSGVTEPIRVRNAQFVEGAIPESNAGPKVLTVNSLNNLVPLGEAGKRLDGDATKGAVAIAVRFADIGTGYWVTPVGPPDPQVEHGITWETICDFSRDIHAGTHPLRFAASSADGVFGPARELPILIANPIPAGKVVFSLTWDSSADLDLHLLAPNGKEVDPKHLTTAIDLDGGLPPGAGILDRDSNAACAQDGVRTEDVVFADAPAPGKYEIRVDMFDACASPGASFVVTVRVDGKATFQKKGRLLDIDADGGGSGAGLLVGDVTF